MKDNKMQITKNESLSKVDEMFCELKNKKKFALMPFIMAGDPNIEITSKILLKLQENGADLIELGIPYSDPLADGPVIQLAASRALKSGTISPETPALDDISQNFSNPKHSNGFK